MKKNRLDIRFILFFCLIFSVALMSSCKKNNDDNTNKSGISEPENSKNNNTDNIDENNVNPVDNNITDDNDNKVNKDNNKIIVPPTVSVRPPTPSVPTYTKPTDTKDGLGDYWFELNSVVSKASDYYFENFSKTRIISFNGRLYNKASATYVDTAYLYEYENLNDRFRWVSADILLLHPSDLKVYSELDVNVSGNDLTVFGARRHPSENKYLISSPNGKCGIISVEKYRELLTKYLQSHGDIHELNPSSEHYKRIIKFIGMYESGQTDYYPRNILCDDKYVFATVSTTSNTADVKQYILKKEGSVYKVVMDGIEKEPRTAIAINKKIPNYNLDMLPDFSVYSYRNSMKSNFNDVIEMLKKEQYIGDYDIKYIGGTRDYCYVVTETNVKYLLTKTGNGWSVQRVSSAYEAKTILRKDSNPPLFIILDE